MKASSEFSIELMPDSYAPALRIRFPRTAILPRGFESLKYQAALQGSIPLPPKSRTYQAWVMSLPKREFERKTRSWIISNPGPEYRRVFQELGFPIDRLSQDLLDEYDKPLIELEPEYEYLTYVYPRFAQWHEVAQDLPELVIWGSHAIRAYTPDLFFHPSKSLVIPAEIVETAKRLALKPIPGSGTEFKDVDSPACQRTADVLAGHTFLADAEGHGRRIAAINAQMARKVERLIVVCQPRQANRWSIALTIAGGEELTEGEAAKIDSDQTFTDFINELEASGLYDDLISANSTVLNLYEDPLQEIGPEITALVVDVDTLIDHPQLSLALRAWRADGLIVDHAEEFSMWESAKTAQMRWLANTVEGLRIPIADATFFTEPLQFIGLLAISGHLDPVFKGLTNYCTTVAENRRIGWITRQDKVEWLLKALDTHVWVRSENAQAVPFE